jgi:hypothetical protein
MCLTCQDIEIRLAEQMKMPRRISVVIVFALAAVYGCAAQMDEICREAGVVPSLDSPFANVPYVYGRVTVTRVDSQKPLRVTVIFSDREQSETRWTVGKSGNYCFKRNNASGGTLVVEVNGAEAARRTLPSFGPNQLREDFEVTPPDLQSSTGPAAISAKFVRPRNDKTFSLYERAARAESDKKSAEAVTLLKEIVAIDPEDFIAWAKLGTIYFEVGSLKEADDAFRHSLESRVDYTPAWVNVGQLRAAQKQFDSAVEIFKHALELEPNSPRIYRLLGEAYLQLKKGTLGAEALNKAIELDPVGMAECHLLLARLYELAGSKKMAVGEYEKFLDKVKSHPDRKKFEKFVKENKGT